MVETKKILVALFLLSFVIGEVYICISPSAGESYPDFRRYDYLAGSLAQGKGYSEYGYLTMQSPPVYPLILAVIYFVFGKLYFLARLFQVALNALSVMLIYLIAEMVFNKRTALWAGLISCLYPSFIIYSGLLLSENVFIFFIVLSAFFWIKALRTPGLKWYMLLGISLGLASLTRATAFLLPFLVLISLWLLNQRKIILKVFILLIAFCVINLPWQLRNYYRYHTFIPVAIGGGAALWIGSINWDSRIEYDERGGYKGAYKEFLRIGQGLLPVEKDIKYRQQALKNIAEHPFKYIGTFPIKLWRFYVRPAGYDSLGGRGINIFKKFCFLLIYGFILIYFLIGTIIGLMSRNKMILICLSIIIYFSLIHIVTNPNDPRYHLPTMPFIIIIASYALTETSWFFKNRMAIRNG